MKFDLPTTHSDTRSLETIVSHLERIALQSDCGSETNFLKARTLRDDLFLACKADLSCRKLRHSGATAFKVIATARSERLAHNLQLRKRIVAAIETAAGSADPARFEQRINSEIVPLYKATQPCGVETRQVHEAFVSALATFRAAIKR